ncbi:phosphatidylserine lipase ABHD16A isoform X2 [Balaenoptera acutorostrata]|uniref:Phosphatidylserine lipase ABHD16A n=2 Tax=Balaenoptera TaxID=9766 RepID=A0A8B8YUP6_BALMU|nr:phosphatidylserine lipase ABHD16A isoform X2 [Balaenoptera musculus]XP_057411607.1 phosphatidylserine lipase ABHD16A isoform X2 [Balaenoptera acutorostrata]
MAKLLSCVLGPRLYKIYRERDSERAPSSVPGTPTSVTNPPSSSWASVFWSISYYSSPFAFFYLYRKGYLSLSKVVPFSHYAGTLLLLLAGVACLRGIGRWTNPQYRQFITILEATHRNRSAENKRQLANYNFDFRSWPVDFHWEEPSSRKESRGGPSRWGVALLRPEPLHRGTADTFLNRVKKLPCQITSYLVAHTLGRRMLYPGSVYLLQKALMPVLLQGQARLVEECNGRRAKLQACDGNEIDTMFVDRRGRAEPQGQKLVICCEGNAGFYEVGCVSTPLEAGYSVLGWNHPGFAGSTGVPFPQNEANAMDVVVQFAIHRLGFQPQDIIIYAWSIGGFTATWAAMSYPDISAVILDASFDDLVPLALKVMPDSWRGLVTRTVRQHLNLNNAEQLCRYQGPVLLIRRTKDEIITTTVPEDIMSNRGNDLLLKLLQHRYPRVMAEEGLQVVRQWLEASSQLEEASIYSRWEVEEDWCLSVLHSYQAEHGPEFPWSVGEDMSPEGRRQLALFLAQKHLHNFEATHCTPLPTQNFQMPWHL